MSERTARLFRKRPWSGGDAEKKQRSRLYGNRTNVFPISFDSHRSHRLPVYVEGVVESGVPSDDHSVWRAGGRAVPANATDYRSHICAGAAGTGPGHLEV